MRNFFPSLLLIIAHLEVLTAATAVIHAISVLLSLILAIILVYKNKDQGLKLLRDILNIFKL